MAERDLAGRVAIVTGSGHGLGRAIAQELAAHGCNIVLNGRDGARVEQAAQEVARLGVETAICLGDVQDSQTGRRLAALAVERWGRIDALVNNSGINAIRPTVELTDEDWHAVIETDLSAPFFCSRAVAPTMIAQQGGCIVNVSSIVGLTAFPMRAAYASAKHGLIGLTKVLAVEWGPHGIRVNAIAPGMFPMDKDMSAMRVTPEQLLARTPLGRFGEAEEVGKLVHYLVSDAAGFVSGATFAIDGAWTAFGGWSLVV
jgi:NAD(P)-dependent dehydrogenase (short-subunit alcohol dehydrogenase family)